MISPILKFKFINSNFSFFSRALAIETTAATAAAKPIPEPQPQPVTTIPPATKPQSPPSSSQPGPRQGPLPAPLRPCARERNGSQMTMGCHRSKPTVPAAVSSSR